MPNNKTNERKNKVKKLLSAIILAAASVMLMSCTSPSVTPAPKDEYKLTGTVTEIDNRHIEINVTDTQNAFGIYRILLSDATRFYDRNAEPAAKSDLCVGDTVEVTYNGQVMRSMPPQVVALKIVIR